MMGGNLQTFQELHADETQVSVRISPLVEVVFDSRYYILRAGYTG
jgi:hypothetical protein